MARGLLVSFAGLPSMPSSLFPDNGLASLAGALVDRGHAVEILDLNRVSLVGRLVPPEVSTELARLAGAPAEAPAPRLLELAAALDERLAQVTAELLDEISGRVEELGASFVGFKLWSGDGFGASLSIAEGLRRRYPALKLFAGGPAVLFSQDTLFELTGAFDALVDGEGELALLGLAEHCDGRLDLADVPSLLLPRGRGAVASRSGVISDPAELPWPRYEPEVYPALKGDEKIKVFVVDESRGCPRGCSFCVHQQASGVRFRVKAPERVVQEVAAIRRLSGSASFRFAGSYVPPGFLAEFAPRYAESGLGGRFCGFSSPWALPVGELERLRAAGCCALFFGAESFDDGDLRALGKRGRASSSIAAIEACQDAGIVPVVSLIVPVPGQRPESVAQNLEVLSRLAGRGPLTVATQFSVLLPRTEWWRRRADYGFELEVSERSYLKLLATYKVRHFLPPSRWERLPFRLDGRDFAGYAAINGDFQRELRGRGIPVNFPDELVLIALSLGGDIVSFDRVIKGAFFSFDATEMGRLVEGINAAIGASSS